jgi:hypothetical protein
MLLSASQDEGYSTSNAGDEHLGDNLLAIAFIHAFEIDLFPS